MSQDRTPIDSWNSELKDLRLSAGFSIRRFALMCDMLPSRYLDIEQGRLEPTIAEREVIMRHLQFGPSYDLNNAHCHLCQHWHPDRSGFRSHKHGICSKLSLAKGPRDVSLDDEPLHIESNVIVTHEDFGCRAFEPNGDGRLPSMSNDMEKREAHNG